MTLNIKNAALLACAILIFLTPFFITDTIRYEREQPNNETETEPAIPAPATTTMLAEIKTTEQAVREYFADIPVMVEIARCESAYRQYEDDGLPLKNREGSSAIGIMQIMASIHEAEAQKIGYDIRTLYGNLAYARYLYEQSGTKPWEESKNCWGSAIMAINMVISDS